MKVSNVEYPKTKREDIFETIHGVKVRDPYRWLEDFNNDEVQTWLDGQHNLTKNVLHAIPNRDIALKRMTELFSLGSISVPTKHKESTFFFRRETEKHSILYYQNKEEKPRVLINPNVLSEKIPIALDWYYVSPELKYLAYGLSENGDEWSLLHIKKIENGEILEDKIPRTRHSSLAWLPDESGFYYTRFPLPGSVPEGQEHYNCQIYFHKIGTNWKDDPVIFGEGRSATNHYNIQISKDGKYLIIAVQKYTKNDLYLLDLETMELEDIITKQDCLSMVKIVDDEFCILTNRNAPRKALYKSTFDKPSFEDWELVIPESENIISQFLISKEKVFILAMKNAYDLIALYNHQGQYLKELDLPKYASIVGLAKNQEKTKNVSEFFIMVTSFLQPGSIYSYNILKDEIALSDEIKSPVDPKDYTVKQVWYKSKDDTKVSMFIVHKKSLKLEGNNPTLLCGYGGFNIALKPPYIRESRFYWLERDGVIAIANLRGGSEYGEEWHKDGMLKNKQNVFDDFIYAGQWLIENKYASNKTLAIFGRSNGGLLTGAAVTQRPDLFSAVYIGVPLLDMIRYQLFSIARYWIPEYGSSEDPKQFEFIYKYSPYHNVKKGTDYPATYLVAAASDSRVDVNHAMKMTGYMQWASSSKEPIILFVERQAGHGAGKPIDKVAEAEANKFTFLGWKTGMKL